MRIAVFGFVGSGGSGASAYILLFEELLKRGCEIDFHGYRGFGIPHSLELYPNFRVYTVCLPLADRVIHGINKLPGPLATGLGFPFNTARSEWYARRLDESIRSVHRRHPYDVALVVDQLSPLRVGSGLPCVSWPQGPPYGEVEPVIRLRDQVIKYCGRLFYSAFRCYYQWRILEARRRLPHSQAMICGSHWAAENWVRFGVPRHKVLPLPFPVDLAQFSDMPRTLRADNDFRFLHLGRIVPRKRLDLLLQAFQLLRRDHPEAKLAIIGNAPPQFRGYQSLLEDPQLTHMVDRPGRIDRSEVPALLRSVDTLVQPSENENFGSAIMESLACGTPVLVGPTNGTKDYLPESSIVFDAYTPESVCRGMKAMMTAHRRSPEALRASARQAAERNFSASTLGDMLLAFLKRVASHRARVDKNGSDTPTNQRPIHV